MKYLFLFIGLLSAHLSFTQSYESIRTKLEAIELESLELRSMVMPTIREFGMDSPQMDSLNSRIMRFDSSALVFVKEVINTHGWLGKREIGAAANRTLFLVIQHAPDNDIRKTYFPLLEASVKKGESEKSDMATMKDRILVQDGKPQIYGTQSHMVNGKLEPFPIEDVKNVNKRRRKVGLGKLKRQ